ncbi:hypothetical protein COY27_00490 [Candidatus Woesearchaeota archaeon CG_4_10_14_0_2_um_filter_33_13]|nr:MAG: hypothetical protein COY27_00490 [Candidatus Woesearchaeota archaeon CG_4_10_14_0_2_um_filter_33_13]
MDKLALIKLGLNKNESKIYVVLLKKGQATAGELIKATEFHRNIVYDNLEKLIDKGLVSFIVENNRKLFQVNSPDSISQMVEKKQKELDEQKKIAEEVKNEVYKIVTERKVEQEATIYRGVKGLKVFFKDTLEEGKDYYVFGAPKESLEIMGSTFWENYNLKREKIKVGVKMIFNDDLREWSKKIQSKLTKVKFLSKKFDTLTETVVYGEKVGIIVWTEKPIVTLIKDINLAKAYKKYFKILWEEAIE